MRRKLFLMLTISLWAFVFSAMVSAQQKFVASLTGEQEVPANNSTGDGVCMITLDLTETQITVNCTYTGLSSAATAGHIHDNGPVGVSGPVLFPFTGVTGMSGAIGPLSFAVTPAQVAELRAKRWYCNIHTTNFPGGEIRGQVKIVTTPFDLDGDGRTNIRVYRPSASAFYTLDNINSSLITNLFNGGGSIYPLQDDFDGDGRSDLALLNGVNGGLYWHILQTATNTVHDVQWGAATTTDIPLPADYDGDGKSDIAVFRSTTGIWYIIQSSDNQQRAEVYGQAGDTGMVGDFDKDGKSDLTVIRNTPNGLVWFTRRSSDGSTQAVQWGGASAPGAEYIFPGAQIDIDGDGAQDRMVVRDPNGSQTGDPMTYYILRSSDNQPFYVQWGIDTDTRFFGDYDGDGKTDFVARRNVNGQYVWFILLSSQNYDTSKGMAIPWGAAGDQ